MQRFLYIINIESTQSRLSSIYIRDADLRNGISEDRRDRSLRTLIRNFYQYHLNEIFYVLR